jgi:hypothetical protein
MLVIDLCYLVLKEEEEEEGYDRDMKTIKSTTSCFKHWFRMSGPDECISAASIHRLSATLSVSDPASPRVCFRNKIMRHLT